MSSKKTVRQPEDESPNLRPYQAPRMESTDSSQVPGAEGQTETGARTEQQQAQPPPVRSDAGLGTPSRPRTPAAQTGQVPVGQVPVGQPATSQAGGGQPGQSVPNDIGQMLANLVNTISLQQQAMATSQEQMHAFMLQQARFQHEMYEMQARANRQKQKANPPKFHGRADEDLELWLFHIEEHFAAYTMEQSSNDSRFVDMVVPFLGIDVMAWYREFKHAMGNNPRTWPVFKQQIRSRYRDNDYEFKLLTKMHDLQISGTQQEYSTKFMQLLSMSSIDMPEIVKRWFYQQNLRADTNSYVSQHGPLTLKDTIDHAQRFEDSRESPKPKPSLSAGIHKQNHNDNSYPKGKGKRTEGGTTKGKIPSKSISISGGIPSVPTCFKCGTKGHKAPGCPGVDSGAPKN